MKTMKTFSRRIAALLLVVTVGITALAPAASAANIQLPSLPKDQCVVDDAGVLSDSTTSDVFSTNSIACFFPGKTIAHRELIVHTHL